MDFEAETRKQEYITADQLLLDSFRLAKKVYDSGYEPDFILALWRGGTPIGVAIHEFFDYKDMKIDHLAIRASRYVDRKESTDIYIQSVESLKEKLKNHTKLLVVDDIFDRGHTLNAVIKEIYSISNNSKEIRTGTVYYKPDKNETDIDPDYYIHETNKWVVFPHELEELSDQEIKQKNPELYKIIKD